MNRDSQPCSPEVNQYEDDWACSLIEWLDKVTGIGWVRAYDKKPGKDDEPSGQYGTIHIDSIKYSSAKRTGITGQTEGEVCVKLSSDIEADIELRVYNSAYMPCENGQKLQTSGDVLMRALDASRINRLSKLLDADKIAIQNYGQINNYVEQLQSSMQRRSSLNITLCISRATSFADDLIKSISLEVGCSENCD